MSAYPDYHLKFTLPRVLALVPAGRHQPCIAGCVLYVVRAGDDLAVDVAGTSPELVREQARRFLRVVGKGHGEMTFPATLISPAPRHVRDGRGGRDSWAIIMNTDVSFAATAIDPDLGLPELQERAG